MSTWLLANEPQLRLLVFVGIFTIMGLWETAAPARKRVLPRLKRWPTNLGLVALSNLAVRLAIPTAAVGVAAWAQTHHIGLLHRLDVPAPLAFVIAIIALDGAIWLQHVASHRIPVLWRLHMVHHADLDLDVTSGTRFHPVEILLSLGYKLLLVANLGASPVAVLVFEVLLNGMAVFNHANVALPAPIERVLRWVIITPEVHRTHHSVRADEGHANFGFNLVIWDRILGTYVDRPREPLVLGLPSLQSPPRGLLWLLALPLTLPRKDERLTPPPKEDAPRVQRAAVD